MPEQQSDFVTPILAEFNTKFRDIEEKQKIVKERLLLIGQNLVELKEKSEKEISSVKQGVDEIKGDVEKIKANIMGILEELEKKARKSELEILAKQAKMFQPLDLVTKSELNRLIKK